MPVFTPALPLHATKLRVPAQVVKVYDGDTFHADARPWPGVTIRVSVRLEGIDTPEMRGKCESEKRAAREAKAALEAILGGGGGSMVTLDQPKRGKYAGRVVSRVIAADGRNVSKFRCPT